MVKATENPRLGSSMADRSAVPMLLERGHPVWRALTVGDQSDLDRVVFGAWDEKAGEKAFDALTAWRQCRVIDAWFEQPPTTYTATVPISTRPASMSKAWSVTGHIGTCRAIRPPIE